VPTEKFRKVVTKVSSKLRHYKTWLLFHLGVCKFWKKKNLALREQILIVYERNVLQKVVGRWKKEAAKNMRTQGSRERNGL